MFLPGGLRSGRGAASVKARVLVVDFEPRSREATLSFLRERGYDTLAVTCTAELNKLLEQPTRLPAIALIEPLLPGTDGFQVCRDIRAARGEQPSLLLVGTRILYSERYRGLAHKAGADFFFKRPDQNEEAVARIAQWLEQQQAALEPAASEEAAVALAVAPGRQAHAGASELEAPRGGSVFSEDVIDQALTGAFRAPTGPDPLPTLVDIPAPAATAQTPPDEAALDAILSRALGGQAPAPTDAPGPPPATPSTPRQTEMDSDAALDALFSGTTPAAPAEEHAAAEKAPLEGMDQGTAELLSTLEELEASVPQPPAEITGTGDEWSMTGGSPLEVETSIPLSPPPPPEEEASLGAVFSSLPSPIAEPVEPPSPPATGATGGENTSTGKENRTGRQATRLPRTPALPRRRLPLVVLLAIGALAAVVVLGMWTLRPPENTTTASDPSAAVTPVQPPPAPRAAAPAQPRVAEPAAPTPAPVQAPKKTFPRGGEPAPASRPARKPVQKPEAKVARPAAAQPARNPSPTPAAPAPPAAEKIARAATPRATPVPTPRPTPGPAVAPSVEPPATVEIAPP
ncbi:MAG TPA: response regulator, partial [Acidobacteria bacterium]|nr:response regulator [Acidobacteriota bacterium]